MNFFITYCKLNRIFGIDDTCVYCYEELRVIS